MFLQTTLAATEDSAEGLTECLLNKEQSPINGVGMEQGKSDRNKRKTNLPFKTLMRNKE